MTFFSLATLLGGSFFANADLYSDGLVTPSQSSKTPVEAGLQSGRYQARDENSDQIIYPKKQKSFLKKTNHQRRPTSESIPVSALLPLNNSEVKKEDLQSNEPTLKEQMSDLLTGGKKQTADIYREQIHPDDVRMNKIELEIGSGVFIDYSKANFAYRSYYSLAPILSVGAKVWLTPLIGFSGNYKNTYGEDVSATTNPSNLVSVKSEWVDLSLDFRKFYGLSRRSNSFHYGVIYNEYKFKPPTSDGTRSQLKSSGMGIYLQTRIPVAPSYAWVFGGEVFPSLSHSEEATALILQSGTSVTSSRVGFNVGGEFKMSRQNQIIWTLGTQLERNQFSGSANLTDPDTGRMPTGVSVTNSWTYFQLGYRWGQ